VNTNPQPVYFRDEDYAGLGRRIAAFILDHVVLLVLFTIMFVATILPYPPDVMNRMRAAENAVERTQIQQEYFRLPAVQARVGGSMRMWVVLCAFYYIALRRLRGGTLGYRLAGIRLVDVTGQAPGLKVLVKRFVLGAIFTAPLGASYYLCLKDERRQSLHDRWCNTWLVRKRAEPAGPAALVHRMQLVMTWAVRYDGLEPAPPSGNAVSLENSAVSETAG